MCLCEMFGRIELAAAGAGIGLGAILATRGPDPMLNRGSSVEMLLDHAISFDESDLNFANVSPHARPSSPEPEQMQQQRRRLPNVPF